MLRSSLAFALGLPRDPLRARQMCHRVIDKMFLTLKLSRLEDGEAGVFPREVMLEHVGQDEGERCAA